MSDLQINARSIYRNLLRAASYLPDLFARAYLHKEIVSQFKRAEKKVIGGSIHYNKELPREFPPFRLLSYDTTTHEKIVKAQKKLRILTGATLGDSKCLEKVLMLAHGRSGRRKRELIKSLIEDDPSNLPQDTAALAAILNVDHKKLRVEANFKAGPKFKAFLQSQHDNQSKEVRGTIKDLQPKIPKENIWGRSLPLKRVENIKERWWATVLNKLLPPIPRDEFERLRNLSRGQAPLDQPPRRRKPAKPLNREDKNDEWINVLKSPLREINEAHVNLIKRTPSGLVMENNKNLAQATARRLPSKKIIGCKRSMRRLYGKIWALTSYMAKNKSTGKWTIQWGLGSSKFLAGQVNKPRKIDLALFSGIEKFNTPDGISKYKKSQQQGKKK
ncbi:hypothetical protein K3495_g5758 [Podosphaera aphanis]|nr:hypothetical protein K3495_g5758 [Podosphaera aphanis]